jgi:hypothetical protein
MSSMTIMATGQLLLGNTLQAAVVIATPVNSMAMTCAAVGAIYYGWTALSVQEQAAILDRVSNGMRLGVEIVKAIINFVIGQLKALMSSKYLVTFKEYIKTQARSPSPLGMVPPRLSGTLSLSSLSRHFQKQTMSSGYEGRL